MKKSFNTSVGGLTVTFLGAVAGFVAVIGLVMALSGCGFPKASTGKRTVICILPIGPIVTESDASEIKGLDNPQGATYTLKMVNGDELTVSKSACLVVKKANPAE